ncbi:TIGR01777 family oxidoreductase [Colwellia asteriadis]|uniref:TIGR01777 family oxidoreductase n=1 Tax=Colwellia asteriadis TaxID=517723 RepID=A0ABP3WFU6_9GAMM
MKFLITGGTGLIGRELIRHLSKDDDVQITVLSRNPVRAAQLLGEHIKLITKLGIDAVEQQNVVINLAGEPIADKRWSNGQKKEICQSRWQITQQLVDLIKRAKTPPALFLSGSAIGFYGRQGSQEVDEDFTDCHHEFSHQLCKCWEQIALGAKSNYTRVALLRTGIVLARNAGALAKMLPAFRLGLGGKIASGEQIMSWIHVDDMVRAITHIIDHSELQGAINMTAPNPVSNLDFSQTIANALSKPCFLPMPSIMVKLLFGEMSDLLIYGQNVVPNKLKHSGFSFTQPTLDGALANILIDRRAT